MIFLLSSGLFLAVKDKRTLAPFLFYEIKFTSNQKGYSNFRR